MLFGEGHPQSDLTPILTEFHPDEMRPLRFCGEWLVLAAGPERYFVVIDTVSKKIAFRLAWTVSGALTSGEYLAFVDVDDHLAHRNLITSTMGFPVRRATVIRRWRLEPRQPLCSDRNVGFPMPDRLKILEVQSGSTFDSMRLGEGIYGNRCSWIRRGFIEVVLSNCKRRVCLFGTTDNRVATPRLSTNGSTEATYGLTWVHDSANNTMHQKATSNAPREAYSVVLEFGRD